MRRQSEEKEPTAWETERDGYMEQALAEARIARDQGEVPVGAVLVRAGTVLARDHNRCEQTGDPTAHAELLCLRAGIAATGGRLADCTLYVTMEPCAMCAGAAVNARLGRLAFGAFDRRAGCCGSVLALTEGCFLHSIETWGGVREKECAALLTEFFAEKRRNG